MNDQYKAREQARMDNGTYEAVTLKGDDPDRFLHISLVDPCMVAYTKSPEKGEADIQTRTTLEKYCKEFGLDTGEDGRESGDALSEDRLKASVWMLGMEIERGDPQAIADAWLAVKKLLEES